MTPKSKLRVACVGAGYFSQFHYESWRRIAQVDLVGACDLELEKAALTGVPAFSDITEMLYAVKADVLDIILPPNAHARTIETALGHQIKTVICQKPFCSSLKQATRLTDLAKTAKCQLVVHENFRFQPWYRAIKRAIEEGRIGTFLQATFRLRPGDGQGDDAYLDRQPYFRKMPRFLIHETGVHWIDTFGFLFGDPMAVYADLRQINPVLNGEDAGVVIFDYAGGARAVFDANRHLDHNADNLRRTMGEALIEGTKGSLTLAGDGSVHLRAFGRSEQTKLLGADRWDGFGGDCVHAFQTHVVEAVLSGKEPETCARRYRKVQEIEEAVYASAKLGHKIRLEVPC